MIGVDLYACSANGLVQRFSASFDCTASWQAHNGIVLSSIITYENQNNHPYLITGGNDGNIKVFVWLVGTLRALVLSSADLGACIHIGRGRECPGQPGSFVPRFTCFRSGFPMRAT